MEQINSIPEPPAEISKPAMSLTARMFNVFTEPGEVFEFVRNSKPSAANWLVPILLSAVIGTLAVCVKFSQPAILQQIHEQQTKAFDDQVKAGKMTQAQADQAEAMVEKFTGPTMMKISGSVGVAIFSFLAVFWWALVLWLLGLIFLKSKFSYLKALEVAGLATVISILGTIVALLLSVSLGKDTTPSLALFVGHFDPKNILHLFAMAANLFSFWLVGVMAVGLSRLAGAQFSKAFLLTICYWLAFVTFLILIGFLAAHLAPGPK
jgi:Yip1 domain